MEVKIARCRSCNANIVWMKTHRGRNMPVDADSVDEDDLEPSLADMAMPGFDQQLGHISHFSTCPDASQHRLK